MTTFTPSQLGTAMFKTTITESSVSEMFEGPSNTDVTMRTQGTGTLTIDSGADVSMSSIGPIVFNSNTTTGAQLTLNSADANINANNGLIRSVALPTAPGDAANKQYVDSVATGLTILDPSQLATVAPLPTNLYNNGTAGVNATLTATGTGALSVDGVVVSLGDRIMVKDEATAANNGLYTVTFIGDGSNPYVLTRSVDFDEAAEMTSGSFTFVEGGNTLTSSGYVMNSSGPVTPGTTDITWAAFSQAGTISAGNGIDVTGSTVSVDTGAFTSISSTITGVHVAPGIKSGQMLRYDTADSSLEPTYGVDIGADDSMVTINPMSAPGTGAFGAEQGTGGIELAQTYSVSGQHSQALSYGPAATEGTMRTLVQNNSGVTQMLLQRRGALAWDTISVTY